MNARTQFQSENFLMSLFGHLILLAIIVFSFSVVIDRAKLVTPNRIQIIEIDLKNIKISGDKTILQNTITEQEKNDTKKEEKTKASKPEPEKKVELEKPTLVEDEVKKTKPVSKKEEKKKEEDKPLPRKKVRVKVNREVLSLDRTMTVSVKDALRKELTRCWIIDKNRPGLENIRLTAHLKMLQSGVVERVWFESESRANTDPDFAYVLETAREAIRTCSPFTTLPKSEYAEWKDIGVTFYPSSGNVM